LNRGREFARVRAASFGKPFRFLKPGNDETEQVHHILKGGPSGYNLPREIVLSGQKPAFAIDLAVLGRFWFFPGLVSQDMT
jgi:hypothetical protein